MSEKLKEWVSMKFKEIEKLKKEWLAAKGDERERAEVEYFDALAKIKGACEYAEWEER